MMHKLMRVLLVIAIPVVGYTTYDWYSYEINLTTEANKKGIQASSKVKSKLDSLISLTSHWVEQIASEIESNKYSKEELEGI